MRVRYHERLTGQDIDVEIPDDRDGAFEILAHLDHLAQTDSAAWLAAFRQYTASDWYLLCLCCSWGQRVSPFTGRPELDCDYMFAYFRESQFDGDSVIDTSARGSFKTTCRTYVGGTSAILTDRDLTIGIFSYDREAATKHGLTMKQEWETNDELKHGWSDVFYQEPRVESPKWADDTGWTVRQQVRSVLPSLSCYSYRKPPTGGRIGLFLVDDFETRESVASEDTRAQAKTQLPYLLATAGRQSRVFLNATYHHEDGVVAQLVKSSAWRHRCHPAEDTSRPAPDIAALYDAAGGRMPLATGPGPALPPAVREMRLDGEPTYMHPLELAKIRLQFMTSDEPGGLASYYQQYMSDPKKGSKNVLRYDWLREYAESPIERAIGMPLVMIVDPSRGKKDPSVAFVIALRPNRTFSIVDGLRRRLGTAAFAPEIFSLGARWATIGTFVQVRIEIYAQAVYHDLLGEYCRERDTFWRIIPVGRPVEAQQRYFDTLEPLLRNGRIGVPSGRLDETDDFGMSYDILDRLREEMNDYPASSTDDILACLALLGEPVSKKIPEFEFPINADVMAAADRERRMLEEGLVRRGGNRRTADWMEDGW